MNALAQLIFDSSDYRALLGDAVALRAAVNARTIERLNPRISSLGIADINPTLAATIRLGVEGSISALNAIPSKTTEQIGLLANLQTFMGWWDSAVPIDFSKASLRAIVDILTDMGAWPNLAANWIKGLGIAMISPAEDAIGHDASEEEVSDAITLVRQAISKQANTDQSHAVAALLDLNPTLSKEEMVIRYTTGLLTSEQVTVIQTALGV